MKRGAYGYCILMMAVLWGTGPKNAKAEESFRFIGYDASFRDGYFGSQGENKIITIETSDVTLNSSNTLSGTSHELELNRSITNNPVQIGTTNQEWRLYNDYSTDANQSTGSIEANFEMAPQVVLNVYPDGEPMALPFYFNTTTNVALTFFNEDETSLGVALLLRKGSGMDESSISGTYTRFTMGSSFADNGANEVISLETSTMQFDGAGNYMDNASSCESIRSAMEHEVMYEGQTVVDTYFILNTPDEDPFSDEGTYSVSSNGTFLLAADFGTITNQVSADGNLIASAIYMEEENSFEGIYLTVAVRQPENMSTSAVDTVYFLVDIGEEFQGYSSTAQINEDSFWTGRSYIYLKSDSTFTIRSDIWNLGNRMENLRSNITEFVPTNGVMDYVSANYFTTEKNDRIVEFDSGTYTIASNGVITLDFGDETGQGQISANGEYIVYGYGDGGSDYSERALGVGIRRNPPESTPFPVTITNMTMTASGMMIQGIAPTNYPVEALYTENITEGEWLSGGILSTDTGAIELLDTDATNAMTRYYMTTFAPW